MKAWLSAFEFAIEGLNYHEAFSVMIRLHELEESRQHDTNGDVFRTVAFHGFSKFSRNSSRKRDRSSTWENCLQTLVSHACNNGGLGWLCSLPNVELLGGTQLISSIAVELDYIANSVDLVRDVNDEGESVNYYECLMAFHLCHSNFAEAATVLQSLSKRISDDGFKGLSFDLQQIW